MSPSSPSRTELRNVLPDWTVVPSGYGTELKATVTSVAFWTAIVLPFLHLPLLATGLENTSVLVAFSALLGLNIVALIVGQPHRRD